MEPSLCHSRESGNPVQNLINGDEICVLNDARREKVYAALYGPKGRKSDFLLISMDDILEKVHGKTLFVGDALAIYRKDIEEAYRKYASKKDSACKCLFRLMKRDRGILKARVIMQSFGA